MYPPTAYIYYSLIHHGNANIHSASFSMCCVQCVHVMCSLQLWVLWLHCGRIVYTAGKNAALLHPIIRGNIGNMWCVQMA